MLELTDKTFKAAIKSDKPVLVDFWAPWCGPCVAMAPQLEKAAEELGDTAVIAKLNIDDNEKVPEKLGIQAIPTLMVFKNGEMVEEAVGAMSKAKIVALVKRHL